MEEKTAEQKGYSMTQTEIDLREAWDRTCAERDDLKNQVKALSAIKRGLETSLSECQMLLASPPIGEREDGFLKALDEMNARAIESRKSMNDFTAKSYWNGRTDSYEMIRDLYLSTLTKK